MSGALSGADRQAASALGAGVGGRAVPFHCPYCGDEDLRPHEVVAEDGEVSSPPGSWECRSCLRAFSLRLLGLLRPPKAASRPGPAGAS